MKIKKTFQGSVPENKILNTKSNSQTDVYSCDYINKLNTYSTEETLTGETWIDGKPLYRIVLQVGALNGTNIKKVNTPENIYFMLPYQGMLIDSYGTEYPINYNNIYNLNQDIGSFYYKNENCIHIKQFADFGIVDGYIIIEYTKTTD